MVKRGVYCYVGEVVRHHRRASHLNDILLKVVISQESIMAKEMGLFLLIHIPLPALMQQRQQGRTKCAGHFLDAWQRIRALETGQELEAIDRSRRSLV